MRKVPAVLLLGVAVPAFSSLAVVTPPRATPKPVAPDVQAVAVHGVDATLLRSAAGAQSRKVSEDARTAIVAPADRGRAPGRPAVLDSRTGTEDFELIGVTWKAGSAADLTVLVRTHGDDGWSEWTALDSAPTPGEADGRVQRAGTEPLYAGPSDGYQVRVDVRSGTLPGDLRVDLVDPGDSTADDSVGSLPAATAAAAAGQPRIYSRKDWGADERLRDGSPSYSSTIKAGFVHHTAGTNGYSQSDVPKILRGIYAYHTKSNGWSDIGYNFLVDRFGRLWEGRYGGITRPVIGAHTGGFNIDTFAVSAIGNYDKTGAPSAMVDSIARLMAWKLSLHYRDPMGKITLVSTGGGTSRYSAGKKVTFNVVSAHRNAGYTTCPGDYLYAKMATIRSKIRAYMNAGLVAPRLSAPSTSYGGSPITVEAGVLRDQQWRLQVRDRCRGRLVRTLRGSASTSHPIEAVWNLRHGSGALARPGVYDLHLESWTSNVSARPWDRSLTVEVTSKPTDAPKVDLPGDASFVPIVPTRLYDSRDSANQPLGHGGRVDVGVIGRGQIPSGGVAAVALNVTATCPSTTTYLTVWPAGQARPNASSLNVVEGATRAGLVVSALGGDGKVSVFNGGGFTDVVVDVLGYYPTSPMAGDLFHPAQPFRLFDSRESSGGALASGETRTLALPSLDGVDESKMTAAVVNVTATDATRGGYLTVYPAGSARPGTSNVNYTAGATVPNRVVTALSSGRLTVANSGGPTHVVVDVVGWYAPPAVAGGDVYRATSPARVLDTREGLGAPKRAVGHQSTIAVAVAGTGKPLPPDASAVVMTLTSTGSTGDTWLTAWPAGRTRPLASDLNVVAGQAVANLVVVPVGSGGAVNLYNAGDSTHLVADVVGYYR